MVRWSFYLIFCFVAEVVALILSPALPFLSKDKLGPINNNEKFGVEPRLPKWLGWFGTDNDNGLLGDPAHKIRHANSSFWWQATCWLARNRAYTLKWSVLSAPMDRFKVMFDGDRLINRNNGHYGELRVKMGDYWQYKLVKPIGSTGYCWMLNFGWLLDDTSQDRALFMFSPRLVKITFQGNVNA